MGQPVNFDMSLAAADADGIAAAQTPGAAGNLLLNGALVVDGVAVLGSGMVEREIQLTTVGDETARTFTIYGTNASGGTLTQTLTGVNAGTATVPVRMQTVTRIAVDAATAGNVSFGTTIIGSSGWIVLDRHRNPFYVGLGITVTGTVNYTVQHTFDPLLRAPPDFTPNVFNHDTLINQTTTEDGNYAFPIVASRVTINSGGGSLAVAFIQAGLRES